MKHLHCGSVRAVDMAFFTPLWEPLRALLSEENSNIATGWLRDEQQKLYIDA